MLVTEGRQVFAHQFLLAFTIAFPTTAKQLTSPIHIANRKRLRGA